MSFQSDAIVVIGVGRDGAQGEPRTGLQIGMDDALTVRGFERLGDLTYEWQRLLEWNRPRASRSGSLANVCAAQNLSFPATPDQSSPTSTR